MAARPGLTKSSPSSVGMMDGAFFVGRNELLRWVNDLLGINCPKVEACASGAIYCQILDACHPKQVPMKKVNWMAKSEHEHIPNYKILQAAFDKMGIQRNVDVDKMIRGKYQDNLEFLQWMKCYFDHTYAGHEYDPFDRREGKQVPDWCHPASSSNTASTAPPAPSAKKSAPRRAGPSGVNTAKSSASSASNGSNAQTAASGGGTGGVGRSNTMPNNRGPASRLHDSQEIESVKNENEDLRITVDGLETERDYYFQKLRDIEILTQTLDPSDPANQASLSKMDVSSLIQEVQRILYKETNDADHPG